MNPPRVHLRREFSRGSPHHPPSDRTPPYTYGSGPSLARAPARSRASLRAKIHTNVSSSALASRARFFIHQSTTPPLHRSSASHHRSSASHSRVIIAHLSLVALARTRTRRCSREQRIASGRRRKLFLAHRRLGGRRRRRAAVVAARRRRRRRRHHRHRHRHRRHRRHRRQSRTRQASKCAVKRRKRARSWGRDVTRFWHPCRDYDWMDNVLGLSIPTPPSLDTWTRACTGPVRRGVTVGLDLGWSVIRRLRSRRVFA
jgi:hypothetical protein